MKKKNFLYGALFTAALAGLLIANACEQPATENPVLPSVLTGVEIASMPLKRMYQPGGELNLDGLEVNAVYSNGTKETVAGWTASPTEGSVLNEPEEITVTVAWSGMETGFTVTVSDTIVSCIAITKNPDKLIYDVGDSLNLAGIEVTLYYLDGSTETITDTGLLLPRYDFSGAGREKRIGIRYGNMECESDEVFTVKSTRVPPAFPKFELAGITVPSSWVFYLPFYTYDIAFADGVFIATGRSGRIARSTDGENWGFVDNSSQGSWGSLGVAGGNGIFVAITGIEHRPAYSGPGGRAWSSGIPALFNYYWGGSDVDFGNNTFVAVGQTGDPLDPYGWRRGNIEYSRDNGKTWTAVEETTFGGNTVASVAFGNGIFVATGTGGKIAYSTDNGETWVSVTGQPLAAKTISRVVFGNNLFVAAAADGQMAWSSDGAVWNLVAADTSFAANGWKAGIAYGGGLWLAGGAGGRLAYSPDLENWTEITGENNPFGGGRITAIACGEIDGRQVWIAGKGEDNNQEGLFYSVMRDE
jgi:hypothetical protein